MTTAAFDKASTFMLQGRIMADRFFTVGDCREAGGFLRACNRTAFAAAPRS